MSDTAALIQKALDLGFEATGNGAGGVIDGQRVSLRFAYDRNAGSLAIVQSELTRPLDLGLEMHRREVARLDGRPGMTGNDDLDAEFVVHGDERERVRPLFWRRLCEQLVKLHRAAQDFRLDDRGCSLFFPSMFSYDERASWLGSALHAAATTVALLDEARVGVPAPAPLHEHAAAIETFAAARGLRWSTTPMLAAGRVDERSVQVGSRRSGRRAHHLVARLEFASALGLGLSLRRESFLDGLRTALGGQDIHAGEAAFDKRFLIRAEPAQASRAALLFDPIVRAQLLEIDQGIGAVHVDDQQISVEPIGAACPPEKVVGVIDALGEIAARIERNLLHGAEQSGPYR
ncbi:MAG: hypothetical protein ABI193_05280 [Minicystis sp.]